MANSFDIIEAADYIGITVPQFRRAVERGELPEPFIKCRPQRWSKYQIDAALEGRLQITPSSPVESDPLMDRLNARRAALRQ